MKAAVYYKNGTPDVLVYEDIPDPVVGPLTVLIRVKYVSLQGGDILNRRVSEPPFIPHVVGYQAAGTVETVGAAVTKFRPGDKVVGFAFQGSHAELFAVEENLVFSVPENMDLAVAATIPVEFGTAFDALFDLGRLKAGETVLIRGAAGGVGMAAVKLARKAGATVIAVAGKAERVQRVIELGAHHGIDYTTQDVSEEVMKLTQGKGVDLFLDMTGGKPLLEACAYRGRYGMIGGAGGDPTPVGFMDLALNSLTIFSLLYGIEMSSLSAHEKIADLMLQALSAGEGIPVERIFPLSQAALAHAYVENNRPVGRVLLETESDHAK